MPCDLSGGVGLSMGLHCPLDERNRNCHPAGDDEAASFVHSLNATAGEAAIFDTSTKPRLVVLLYYTRQLCIQNTLSFNMMQCSVQLQNSSQCTYMG